MSLRLLGFLPLSFRIRAKHVAVEPLYHTFVIFLLASRDTSEFLEIILAHLVREYFYSSSLYSLLYSVYIFLSIHLFLL
jgi:hypothetical protein